MGGTFKFTINVDEVIIATFKSVRFHKDERTMFGALLGTDASNYVAQLD